MTTCPTCGAQNDPGNRFCDQCGTRLEAPAAAPDQGFVAPDQPTMAAPTCPKCGSTVLPGEAFCDNCGADLTAMPTPAAPVAADAPTMLASAPAPTPAPAGADVACPNCGQMNLPGEAFCDNCGASLAAPAPAPAPAPTAAPDDATMLAPTPMMPEPQAAPEAAPVQPAAAPVQPDDATMLAPAPGASEAAPAPQPEPEPAPAPQPEPEPAPAPQPEPEPAPAPQPEPEPAPAPAASGPDPARKAELEAEIGRQQQIITQFEQMQGMFGAATPPAVTAGLDEARANLARAQADLAALAPAAPAVDPEAVKQLEDAIARQQQIIAQFEQMQGMFGAATPPAVTAGLDEARANLARAQADLATLTGGAPVAAATTAAPVSPATAATATAPAAPPEPAPAPAPAATPVPRLMIADGGQALNLPTDKAEIIIGREDPVSNIFPEVDLTSFGGEAGGVSRQHAKITHSGGQWMLTDLNSTNFTRVDGVRLEPYVDTPLHDGARVQFGRVVATFKLS